MFSIHYASFINSLGLSNHPRQAARRMKKYPQHFEARGNELFISAELANFLSHCKAGSRMADNLKGGAQ